MYRDSPITFSVIVPFRSDISGFFYFVPIRVNSWLFRPDPFIDCRISDLVIPRIKYGAGFAEAGIQMPSFTGEVIFAQIRKLALDIGPQFAYSAH
jgi:hypothetical protein